MEILLTVAAIAWVGCAVLGYGMANAYYDRGWPMLPPGNKKRAARIALVASLIGPIGAILIYFLSKREKYGLKFR